MSAVGVVYWQAELKYTFLKRKEPKNFQIT